MIKLKYFLLIFIIFLTPKVFAAEYNMNSHTSATLNGTKNRYRATEIYNSGISNIYTFGTRYSGRISDIETYFDYPFVENTTYRLTYNMSTEDFRNNFSGAYWYDCDDSTQINPYRSSVSYISYKKVQVSFKPNENTTCIRMWLKSTSLSSVAITGVSNWNLSSITIYDPDFQSGSGSGQGSSSPSPSSSPSGTQDIINNQNDNTQDIINNQNDNTSDIIENNNSNTDKIIDNNNQLLGNCYKNLIDVENSRNSSGYYGYFVELEDGETYTLKGYNGNFGYKIGSYISGYTDNENWDGNQSSYTFTYHRHPSNSGERYIFFFIVNQNSETSITLPNNNYKFVLTKGNYNGDFIPYLEQKCTSKIDETNNYLQDDTDPDISDNEFLSMFNSIGISDPLNYLLTLPVQLINKIVSLSGSCTAINLGTLYGTMLSLPCINLENIIGSTVWNIIDVICSVSLLVVIFKNLYDTFSNLLTMGAQKEAKEKFSMPTPMDFLSMILGGDR